MRSLRTPLWSILAAVVHCSLSLAASAASAEAPDDSLLAADADTEENSERANAPRFIETQIVAKAPAPTYSKNGALLDVICNLRLDYPHSSSHVDGTVNVESQVTCNTPVTGITLLLQLYYNGSVANSSINENVGAASLYNQVAAPCINGGWQAHAEALVIFPPGVTPPSAYESQDTPPLTIDCSL